MAPPRDWPEREISAYDQQARLTARVARRALVFVPSWLVLLLAVPQTGLGPMPSLLIATLGAIAVVVGVELALVGPWLRRHGEGSIDVGLIGRVALVGGLVWTFVLAMPGGPESPWLTVGLATAAAVVAVVAVELLAVRPVRARRARRRDQDR
ncbi:MAG: hypothetical protein MUE51_07690 [Thermoleophilia bacterium]|jgi:hypothetical protein|nr:hypothetical protein [Thermoleophilia bacterium]